jgi:hypothetical protein
MRPPLGYLIGLGLAATTACGGADSPTGPLTGPGTMTASINGSAWTATITKRAFRTADLVTIQGQDNANRIITIVVRASATGSFPLTVANGLGHNASYTVGASNWSTALINGTGSINFTTLSATQVVGSFSFTAISPVAGTSPVQVATGQFDLPIS